MILQQKKSNGSTRLPQAGKQSLPQIDSSSDNKHFVFAKCTFTMTKRSSSYLAPQNCSFAATGLLLFPQRLWHASNLPPAALVVTAGSTSFLACEDFGRVFDHSFPACAFCVCVLFFFFKWRLAHAHKFHSLWQDQSTVAQQAEMTVAKRSLKSCVWAHFWIGSHTMPQQRLSQSTPTSLGQGCMHV